MNSTRLINYAALVAVFVFLSACRLQDVIVQFRSAPTEVAGARVTETMPATFTPVSTLTPTITATLAPSLTPFPTPTFPPSMTPLPPRTPTRFVSPTVTRTATITVTPTPDYYYKVSLSSCGPSRFQTFIEGIVYENGAPRNGVLVRISQGPDGEPDPNPDDLTGEHRDLSGARRNGYYFQAIDVARPRGGLWYLWVIDPDSRKRVSTISIVKTDPIFVEDTATSSGSCQHADVNFSNLQGVGGQPTATCAPTSTRTATPTGTLPTATATATGTPPTPTQTPTGCP